MTLSGNGHNEQLQVPSSSLWALMADHWNSTDEMSCPGYPLVQMSLLWGCASVCCVVSAEGALWMPPQLSHRLSARVLPEGTRDRMQSLSSQSNKKLFLPREAGRHIKESSVEGYFFFLLSPTLDPALAFFRAEYSGRVLDEVPWYFIVYKAWKMYKLFLSCPSSVIQRNHPGNYLLWWIWNRVIISVEYFSSKSKSGTKNRHISRKKMKPSYKWQM